MSRAVLIVDDSAVVRKLIRDRLASDPDLVVVGNAADGQACVDFVEQTVATGGALDVVILDEEMPRMAGSEVLRVLRRRHPHLAIVLFSARVEIGEAGTLDAMFLGADDAVRKPSALGDAEETWLELLDKVHAAIDRHAQLSGGATAPEPIVAEDAGSARPAPFALARPAVAKLIPDLLVVGSSTGGPAALSTFLTGLGGRIGVPIAVVQHMPPVFTRRLAERLDRETGLRVVEAETGTTMLPDHVYVAPGGFHLEVHRRGFGLETALTNEPLENSCRPAVDVLFRTAAAATGNRTLGVVLTGMGQDGREGARRLVDAGGRVLVQDEASAVVWGMPGAVAQAGLADAALGIDALALEVAHRLRTPSRGRTLTGGVAR